MAQVLVCVQVNPKLHTEGKIVNVYDTYAHALAGGATGLVAINAVAPLTGAAGSAISQAAGSVGLTIDINGRIDFYVDAAVGTANAVFLTSSQSPANNATVIAAAGPPNLSSNWGAPRRIYVQ